MNLLASIATLCTAALFTCSLWQVRRIIRNKTVGDLSFYPSASTYLNCMLWLRYGVAINDSAVSMVNALGALLGTIAMFVYYVYSSDKGDVEKKCLQLFGILFAVMAAARLGLLSTAALGTISAMASVAMLGAPLADLRNILRKQDSAVLSLPFIVMASASCLLWTAYGIMRADVFIVIPNALGVSLALIQLYVFLKYRGIHPQKFFPKDRLSYDQLDASLPT